MSNKLIFIVIVIVTSKPNTCKFQLYIFVNYLFVYFVLYSTVSSAVNSLAAVCIEDMVKPALRLFKNSEPTDATYTWITKGIGWCSHEVKSV